MSFATCRRWIVLGLIGTIAVGSGCTSTRFGSMPKWNLAWWKKDSAGPQTRHDELAPPSATISPSTGLATKDSDSVKTGDLPREPYKTDGSDTAKSGPPAPRSFELSRPEGTNTGTAGRGALPSPSSQLIDTKVPERQSNGISGAYDSSYMQKSSAELPGDASIDSEPPAQMTPEVKPQRYQNPYVNKAEEPKVIAPTENVSLPSTNNTSPPAGSNYVRTPYKAFTPKAPAGNSPMASPLLPMRTPTTETAPANTTTTKGLPNIRPLDNAPKEIPVALPKTEESNTANTHSPAPAPAGGAGTASASPLPDILMQSQGSYAPGSIRAAQSMVSPSSAPSSPMLNIPPTQPAPAPTNAMPPATTPTSTSTIGGGGSFMLK